MDVVALGRLELATGVGQPSCDGRLVVGPAGSEAAFEDLGRRRLDEDEKGVGHLLADLQGPLDVDHQDDAVPLGERLADRLGGGAVMSRGPRPIRGGRPRQSLELLGVDEVIVDAVASRRGGASGSSPRSTCGRPELGASPAADAPGCSCPSPRGPRARHEPSRQRCPIDFDPARLVLACLRRSSWVIPRSGSVRGSFRGRP